MSNINECMLEGLRDELRKLAAPKILPSSLTKILGSAGAGGGMGAGAGALVGGVGTGYKAYQDAKAQGASTGQAVAGGLMGGMGGAATGAAIGAGVGLAGGAAYSHLRPQAAEATRKYLTNSTGWNPAASAARFGQRQMHGVTGWTPKGGLGEIQHSGAAESLKDLKAIKKSRDAGEIKPGLIDRALGRSQKDVIKRKVDEATKTHKIMSKSEEMGLTSIPGYARSLVKHGPVATAQQGFRSQMVGNKAVNAAMLGLPALEVGSALTRKNDGSVDDSGNTKHQAVGSALGTAAGFTLLGPMAAAPMMLAGAGIGAAGKHVGTMTGKKPKVQAPSQQPYLQPRDLTTESGQNAPTERVVSDRAQGIPPQGAT